MDDHHQHRDECVQDQLERMILLLPTKKIKTMRGTKTVLHPYTSRMSDALKAIYPAPITDEPTQASIEAFGCWWHSFELGNRARQALRVCLGDAGTHPSFINCTLERQPMGYELKRTKGSDEEDVTTLWKVYKTEGTICGTDIGNPYDASVQTKTRFRALVRELTQIQTAVGWQTDHGGRDRLLWFQQPKCSAWFADDAAEGIGVRIYVQLSGRISHGGCTQ